MFSFVNANVAVVAVAVALSSLCVTGNTTKHDTTVIYFLFLFLCTPFCKKRVYAVVSTSSSYTVGNPRKQRY